MRQEDLCKEFVISINEKPSGTKYKCPACNRRLPICSKMIDGGDVKYWISQHNPKGFKKQKKTKLKKSKT